MEKKLKIALYAVTMFGVALTIVTELSHHYPWIMELCGGDSSGCADVASTPYSKMFGVSVAYWGLLSYIVFGLLLAYFPAAVLPMAAALLGAEFYFLWVMAAVIHVYCLFCLIQFFTVVVLFVLTAAWSVKTEKFLLPGKLWPVPIIALVVFIGLALPVTLGGPSAPSGAGELVTYEGDPDADVRVEIFSDYECPHCRKMEAEVDKIRENHPNVLIVYRDYIIRGHKISPVAASYVNALAFTSGREEYLEARRKVFENQESLYGYLKPLLEEMEFTDDLKRKVTAKVNADMKRAEALGVYLTPTMAIYHGGKLAQIIRGYKPYEKIAAFLSAAP
ncbi:MAG: thioredoxin domain-containing protein [Candidatus Nitrospinota bacterium M3_3B_026]